MTNVSFINFNHQKTMNNSKNLNLISKNLSLFFNELALLESKSSGFIKRNRKISGSDFLKTICFSNISNSYCSLENMCQLLAEDSIELSKQGLDKKFCKNSVKFMNSMFNHSINLFQNSLPIDVKLLQEFNSIKLLDSSHIKLPNFMKDIYKGYGSGFKDYKKNDSSIKLQLSFDYLNSSLTQLDIKEGVRSDQGYKDYLDNIKVGDLSITDLGYFVPKSFKKISDLGAYFISRYKADTNLCSSKDFNSTIDLAKCLSNNDKILRNTLYLGSKTRLPIRIIYQKIPQNIYDQRLRKANKAAKSQGHKVSDNKKKLMQYNIFITNINKDKLSDEQIILLYKSRWQIELLFKLYKSQIVITYLKGKTKTYRILCELYAKLTIIAIFHGLVNCIKLKQNTEISFTKAVQELKRRSRELAIVISLKITKIKVTISKLLKAWSLYAIKDKHRKKRLSNLNILKENFA